MTIIRANSIQCVADEASATRYWFEGGDVQVLAYSLKEAETAYADYVAGKLQAAKDNATGELPL